MPCIKKDRGNNAIINIKQILTFEINEKNAGSRIRVGDPFDVIAFLFSDFIQNLNIYRHIGKMVFEFIQKILAGCFFIRVIWIRSYAE